MIAATKNDTLCQPYECCRERGSGLWAASSPPPPPHPPHLTLLPKLEFRRMAKDQNFDRGIISKRNPELCPCVTPGGKYIVTHLWCELTGKAWYSM